MRPLLVLRPEPGASATAERARRLGLDAVAVPLFEVEKVEWAAPDATAFDALLLTSANATRFGGESLKALLGLPVHAVGKATADAAREAGFAVATVGDAGVGALLASLDPKLALLHLCGQDRRVAAGARQSLTSIIVYRSREIATPGLKGIQGSVALIHSPRAGARFAALVDDAGVERGSIAVAAISPAAADAVGPGWNIVASAEMPNDDALLALAEELCNKPAAT